MLTTAHHHEHSMHGPRSAVDPHNVVVGLLCPIGDTLFATPALAALRRRFPRAYITALAYRSNAGILEGNPAINECVVVDPGKVQPLLLRLVRAVGTVEWSEYDLMINFSPASSFVGLIGGVRDQVHMKMPRHWWLVGGRDSQYRSQHSIDHYLRLVQPLLTSDLSEEERIPRIYLDGKHRAAARRLLRERHLTPANQFVTMHVGADGFQGRKRWSPGRFATVAKRIAERFDMHVLLLGGTADFERSTEVAEAIGSRAVVLAGHTSLMETAALIERSILFIGNDSCPLHIAAAVGTPAVGIYGPTSAQEFGPVGRMGYRQRVVHAGLPCSPCFHFVGNNAPWVPNLCYSYACLKAIQPEDVIAAATSLLTEDMTKPVCGVTPPSEAPTH